jgi:hypothetical protein
MHSWLVGSSGRNNDDESDELLRRRRQQNAHLFHRVKRIKSTVKQILARFDFTSNPDPAATELVTADAAVLH